jgi:hypothetical protein
MTSFIICCFHFYLSVSLCHDPFNSVLQTLFDILPLLFAHNVATWGQFKQRESCQGKVQWGWDKSVVQCPATWMGLTRTL